MIAIIFGYFFIIRYQQFPLIITINEILTAVQIASNNTSINSVKTPKLPLFSPLFISTR